MTSISQPGATACERSTRLIDGILGTKISPPCISSMERSTKRTPCSRVSQKRVICGSVMVRRPFSRWARKIGITLPRLATTLP